MRIIPQQITRIVSAGFVLIVAFFACAEGATKVSNDSSSAPFWTDQGVKQLGNKEFDAALGSFARAFKAGLSKDSLCYLCAEAYLSHGAFDTALAFNFGITATRNPDLEILALKQRVVIYSMLGWKKDVTTVMDSLVNFRESQRRIYIPDIVARLGVDYTNRRERQQPWYPYQDPVTDTLYKGPGIGGNIVVAWSIPAGRLFLAHVGLNGTETSKYYRSANSADSVNVSVGLSAGLQHRKSRLSLDYEIARSVDYVGEYLTQNTIALSMPISGKLWQTYVSGGYMLELEAANKTRSQTCWLLGYFTHPRPSGDALSLCIRGSGYFASPLITSESFHVMYVDNVHGSPVRHYYVNTQTQSPADSFIPINSAVPFYIPSTYENNSVVKSAASLFGISENFLFTQNQLSIAPLVDYKMPFGSGVFGNIGFQATASYYPDIYRWITFNVSQTVLDSAPAPHDANGDYYLALNAADGNYYWVKDLDNITSGQLYTGPVETGRQYEKRRVDAELSGYISLSRPVWKLGTFSLRFDCAKTYSTLRSEKFLWWVVSDVNTPFAIPNWSYGVSVIWNYARPSAQ